MPDIIYHLNHKEIDRQHAVLFKLFDKCKVAFNNKDTPAIKILISDLIKYGIEHFRYEEDAMIYSKYPQKLYDEHVIQHSLFKAKMLEVMRMSDEERGEELLNYVVKWFASHVNVIDRKFVDYLAQIG